eukprot:GEMP01085746.1.p1 GENE.GEMP01085746.1~~GEMP01085746.1.p1  ORF type:complete len:159 (-),score=39.24 GEMP01085746.1:257-733(-)
MPTPDNTSESRLGSKSLAQTTEDMRQAFNVFDVDKQDRISVGDLQVLLSRMGFSSSDDDVRGMIKEVNSSGDKVDFIEFEQFCTLCQNNKGEEDLYAAFNMFDQDGDGLITEAELSAAWPKVIGEELDPQDLKSMLEFAGITSSRKAIDFSDFKLMMA